MDMQRAERAVFDLLSALGEDVDREGLQETPRRVAKMYAEVLSGMKANPCELLKFFDEEMYPKCYELLCTIEKVINI